MQARCISESEMHLGNYEPVSPKKVRTLSIWAHQVDCRSCGPSKTYDIYHRFRPSPSFKEIEVEPTL